MGITKSADTALTRRSFGYGPRRCRHGACGTTLAAKKRATGRANETHGSQCFDFSDRPKAPLPVRLRAPVRLPLPYDHVHMPPFWHLTDYHPLVPPRRSFSWYKSTVLRSGLDSSGTNTASTTWRAHRAPTCWHAVTATILLIYAPRHLAVGCESPQHLARRSPRQSSEQRFRCTGCRPGNQQTWDRSGACPRRACSAHRHKLVELVGFSDGRTISRLSSLKPHAFFAVATADLDLLLVARFRRARRASVIFFLFSISRAPSPRARAPSLTTARRRRRAPAAPAPARGGAASAASASASARKAAACSRSAVSFGRLSAAACSDAILVTGGTKAVPVARRQIARRAIL